ncbi:VOC family protein [Actinopolymorpha sp. B17G11]|uniref:VOC family protein n=1 Tax=unclassified Actinopolymorpha TaxID=2627063 RepID=UPI0032D9926F
MDEPSDAAGQVLTRQEISAAVSGWGWRYVLGVVRTSIQVRSLAEAARVAATVVDACGGDVDGRLTIDVRRFRVVLSLQSSATASITSREIELAGRISSTVGELQLSTTPDVGTDAPRSVQLVELGIDALDIALIRPFWKAVMGYADEPGASGPQDPLVDPIGQGPAIWFQQMDAPRPQRNRIHLDVSVPHDEAAARIQAAMDAGGRVLSDAAAPAFWVLADPEGNEACVCTWQGRDG